MTKNEIFVEKARKVHGNKYDYSKVEYINSNTKVCIICPEHGEFWQTPKSHIIQKYGCKKCGRKIVAAKLKKTKEGFINESKEIHGDRYDYSKVEYVNAFTAVSILCSKHGYFEQMPNEHLKGCGCPSCSKENIIEKRTIGFDDYVKKAREVHGEKYIYIDKNINSKKRIEILCPEHGVFTINKYAHINGQGCKECGKLKISEKKKLPFVEFLKRSYEIHGDKYDYSKVEFVDINTKVCIICPEHGEFWQTPKSHMEGHGCKLCGHISTGLSKRSSTKKFVEKSKKVHNDKYDYSKTSYITKNKKVIITCPIHGDFSQTPDDHLMGKGCPMCGISMSKNENEILLYLRDLLGENNVESRNRSLIKPYEIDIYIPSMKIGIEYNGLVWHSTKYKENNYHLMKTNMCREKGIRLIQIFEDEYIHHKDVVLSKLRHILRIDNENNLRKVYGRKCVVKEIVYKEGKEFLDRYHIQGCGQGTVYLGSFYNGELIGVMSFKRERNDGHKWELTRFATKDDCICCGIGGKLFKYFIDNYEFVEIKSFADRRWTDEYNNIYLKLGFKFDCYTSPSYTYYNGDNNFVREHKFGYRKDKLSRLYDFDINMTENEMIEKLGYYKIYDSGLIRYFFDRQSIYK